LSGEPELRIRDAVRADVPVILRMIRGLAEYEKLSHEVTATEEKLSRSLFGARPAAEVLLAQVGAEPVGFAVHFSHFSTFLGSYGIYLEDLFVDPAWRGRGFGKQLLAHLARIAVARGCPRLEWSVLDWNEPAIRFYKSLGAQSMDDWTVFRLNGEPLGRLAGMSRPR
jgi:GNAT superfamily N-acetyltransferase